MSFRNINLTRTTVLLFAVLSFGLIIGCKPKTAEQQPNNLMKSMQNPNPEEKYAKNIVSIAYGNTSKVTVDPQTLTINVSGTMEPIRTAVVNSKEDGTCIGYFTKDKRIKGSPGELPIGTEVIAGEVLVELEYKILEQQIVSFETQLATMKYGVDTEDVNEAESSLALAEKTYNYMKELYEKKSIPETKFDSFKMQYEMAKAGYDKLLLSINAMEKNLEALRKRFDDLKVKAPFNGKIVDVFINPGEFASGMTKTQIFSIVDDSYLDFSFGVPEEYANYIDIETTSILITLTDGRNLPDGKIIKQVKITSIAPLIDSQNRNIICKARVPNYRKNNDDNQKPIVAGIFAKAQVTFQIQGMFIPTQSIVSDEDQDYVFVQQGNIFQKMSIKTGKIVDRNDGNNFIEVLSKNLNTDTEIILNARAKMLDADMITFEDMTTNQ